MEWQDFPSSDGSAVWVDSAGNVVSDQSDWYSTPGNVAGGGFFGGLGNAVGSFLTTGIPRIMDAKANIIRAENTRPVVYRNGKAYPIDPDAYRYGMSYGQVGGSGTMLLILGAAALFLLAKD